MSYFELSTLVKQVQSHCSYLVSMVRNSYRNTTHHHVRIPYSFNLEVSVCLLAIMLEENNIIVQELFGNFQHSFEQLNLFY